MKKACSAMTLGAAVALVLAACGTPPAQRPTRNLEGAKNFTACMLSDEGGFDDHSFNESGKKGLDRAGKELGVKTIAVQSENSADYATNIYALIQQNCKLVIGVGFNIAADLTESAKANPDIQFALIDASFIGADGKPATLPNTKPLLFKTAEAAYLAGYAAAGTSRTGVVGTYGGKPLPTVQIFMDGFAKGVARYNQDTGAQVQVKGWDTTTGKGGSFVGNFTDAAKGQAITEQFISQGADVIMPVAGPVGQGTLSSVRQKNDAGGTNAVIWVDSDGYTSSGDGSIIMTSVVKEIGNSVFDTVKNASEGRFSSEPYIGTLKNNGVAAAPFHDFDSRVPAPVKARLEELRGQIIDGSLDVSTPYDPS